MEEVVAPPGVQTYVPPGFAVFANTITGLPGHVLVAGIVTPGPEPTVILVVDVETQGAAPRE